MMVLAWQDVGMAGELRIDNYDDPGAETYILLNGLSVDTDAVLGDYTVWGRYAQEDAMYTITARSGGELLWVVGGTVGKDGETPRFTATVTEYAESDCNIPAYGEALLPKEMDLTAAHYLRCFRNRVRLCVYFDSK